MSFDLKTATPDTSLPINGVLFGADSQASANPSVYPAVNVIGVKQTSKSADYTLTLADAGTHILHPSSDATTRTFTIPANASVAYPIGSVITFINAGGSVTIAINSDTMYLAGTAATTGSRTLDAYGMASAIKIDTTTWVISGSNLY
jgi:hypothetical protein